MFKTRNLQTLYDNEYSRLKACAEKIERQFDVLKTQRETAYNEYETQIKITYKLALEIAEKNGIDSYIVLTDINSKIEAHRASKQMAVDVMKVSMNVYDTAVIIKNAASTLNIIHNRTVDVLKKIIKDITNCSNYELVSYNRSIDLVFEQYTESINVATTSSIALLNASGNVIKLANIAFINNLPRIVATYASNVYTVAGGIKNATLSANTASTIAQSVAKDFASVATSANSLSAMAVETTTNEVITSVLALVKIANDAAQFYADIVISSATTASSTAEANIIEASKLGDKQVMVVKTTCFKDKTGNFVFIDAKELASAISTQVLKK